jgi:hypothetical protein
MQDRFAVFTGSNYACSHYLVGAIDWQEHWVGRHFIRIAGADNDLTTSDTAY